ncbi:MAG: RNA-binding S4 domain-containing protein [Clostridia bacterium]
MEIKIHTPYIKLDQFLKYAGIVHSGAMAKEMILSGEVRVNGETETRRGKKLVPGDLVVCAQGKITVK